MRFAVLCAAILIAVLVSNLAFSEDENLACGRSATHKDVTR